MCIRDSGGDEPHAGRRRRRDVLRLPAARLRRHGQVVVGQHQVEAAGRQVALQRGHVVGHAVTVGLARLRGQVADVDDASAGMDERLGQVAQ